MNAILVAGLGFGDEGKGSTCDAIVRRTNASLVIRYNGGAQAGHNVTDDLGHSHTFSQFGSGTLAGAHTHLSRFALLDPPALANEADHLEELGIIDPFSLLSINPDAPLITPYHVALNQLRELSRGELRHGSCGRGIGELASDVQNGEDHLTAGLLWYGGSSSIAPFLLASRIRDRLCAEAKKLVLERSQAVIKNLLALEADPSSWLSAYQARIASRHVRIESTRDVLRSERSSTIVFEGAQGMLLDQTHGFHPHTTWSDITFANAYTLLQEADRLEDVFRLGVLRTFSTRHGAGPFPTESSALAALAADDHNKTEVWQGRFRVGHLDLRLARYAVDVIGGVDGLSLTHVDKFQPHWPVAVEYEGIRSLTSADAPLLARAIPDYRIVNSFDTLRELIEDRLANISILSSGPRSADKIFHSPLTSLASSSR
jgi:adenylosuccinate synthase